MLSFQCSRHSTPESIEDVFMDCADIQIRDAARKPFVSVVVLDEIGLAEDSEKMPLKVNNMFDHSVFSVCKKLTQVYNHRPWEKTFDRKGFCSVGLKIY